MEKDWDSIRREFWTGAYLQYVGASNSRDKQGGEIWADTALEAFDKRFPRPKEVEPPQPVEPPKGVQLARGTVYTDIMENKAYIPTLKDLERMFGHE